MIIHRAAALEQIAGPLLADAIDASIAATGRCRLGLPGGSTPGPTLRWLADHLPASSRAGLWVTWVDERNVPLSDPLSNHHLAARSGLLDAAARTLPMCDGGPLADAQTRFTAAFAADFDGALDVVLLGVGGDGHIASLFPGHRALEARGLCVAITDSPKPPAERLSLTLPVLEAVSVAVLLARGSEKAAALVPGSALPIGRYQPIGAYHHVLDDAAAAALGK